MDAHNTARVVLPTAGGRSIRAPEPPLVTGGDDRRPREHQ